MSFRVGKVEFHNIHSDGSLSTKRHVIAAYSTNSEVKIGRFLNKYLESDDYTILRIDPNKYLTYADLFISEDGMTILKLASES